MSGVDVVSVLAGGWSAGPIDKSRLPGFIIGVNDAAIYAKVDAAITMDRLWAENRYEQLRAGHFPKPVWLRQSAIKNLPKPLPDFVNVFANDHQSTTFSDKYGTLNGTNSGFCALNLAYQLRPKTLFMFGFDMNRSPNDRPYWFPDYPWAKAGGATTGGKYKAWAGQFDGVSWAFRKAGIEVFNASPTSAIESFHKIDPNEVLV